MQQCHQLGTQGPGGHLLPLGDLQPKAARFWHHRCCVLSTATRVQARMHTHVRSCELLSLFSSPVSSLNVWFGFMPFVEFSVVSLFFMVSSVPVPARCQSSLQSLHLVFHTGLAPNSHTFSFRGHEHACLSSKPFGGLFL